MNLTHKDLTATGLTAAIVLTFFATHEGWGVPLVGDSHRWAAVVITLLGMLSCAQGSPGGTGTKLFAGLGISVLVLAIVAIVTGSLTALSLLVAVDVFLWASSTFRHVRHAGHKPVAA
jgi:hypothetical protein